jgi:hypothetical protein
MARTGGILAERLLRPQMGAAAVAVIMGAVLWHHLHEGSFGTSEKMLAIGAVCAIIAGGIQGISAGSTLRKADSVISAQSLRSIAKGQRAAAGLLAITIICMSVARYV